MKVTKLNLPVMSSWLENNQRRLDASPFLSGAFEARVILNKLKAKKEPLKELTKDGIKGIFNGPRFARNYVNDPDYGLPLLSGADMLQAELNSAPFISKKQVATMPHMVLEEGTTLISSYGTIGRTAYCRLDMAGMVGSDNTLKVIPNTIKILPGYLYAYLSSKFGVPLVISGLSGSIITFLDPKRVADLPVPRLGEKIETEVHNKIAEAARLRTEYQAQVKQATDKLFSSVGLQDITSAEWHRQGSDLGFVAKINSSESLRALNFNFRFQKIINQLSSVRHQLLGDICQNGELRSGLRFKRIDCDTELAVKLIGQKEIFWFEPEGRWISANHAPKDIFVQDETILIAAQGTLGENEVFCRAEMITGSWLNHVYSQHFIRVRSGDSDISGAFLFAFLRSETVFRCLRSMSMGSKQQDIHRVLLKKLPVPIPPQDIRSEIENTVRKAYRSRQKARLIEDEAVKLVEQTIEEGANG